MNFYREMDDVVEAVRNAKRREKKCVLLIGAGCSVSAGIPMASGFVDLIRKDWNAAYKRAAKKAVSGEPGYPQCMAELSDAERRDLIADHVEKAKINWAHIGIAQLIKMGFVDLVFTTNFDPLILRACALLGIFPAIYDFAASQRFKPAYLPDRAVFHLHGQHTGFVLLHTREDVERLSKSTEPLFDDAGRRRLWIIAGYSGKNDPVFEHLAKVERFDERLYWVGFKDGEPDSHVRERLLSHDKSAYFVKGYTPDDFFVTLAQQLGCFPPTFVEKPFSHLSETMDTLTPYVLPRQKSAVDIRITAQVLLEEAVKNLEQGSERDSLLAERFLMADQPETVLEYQSDNMSPQLNSAVAWAHVMIGNKLLVQANENTGEQADALFAQAGKKYAAGLALKQDNREALYNWGIALASQARTKTGPKADALFAQAGEKYAAVLAIQPDNHGALNNWGNALSDQAQTKEGEEADALFARAGEKYAAALTIQPDDADALYNWGVALADQAKTKEGEEADALFTQAGERYAAALAIQPDKHEAFHNWGNVLARQALTKTGTEADALLTQAREKYAALLALKPNDPAALNNLGTAFSEQAKTKSGEVADALFKLAIDKFMAAETISPGSAAYSLACVASLQGDVVACKRWLEKSRQMGHLPSLDHLSSDSDLDNIRANGWLEEFLSQPEERAQSASV